LLEEFKEFRTFQSQLNILRLFQQSAIALFLLGSKVETKQTQGSLTQLQRTKVILRFFFTFPTKHTNKQTNKQTHKTHKQKKTFSFIFLAQIFSPSDTVTPLTKKKIFTKFFFLRFFFFFS
jgi:hypothetical protein